MHVGAGIVVLGTLVFVTVGCVALVLLALRCGSLGWTAFPLRSGLVDVTSLPSPCSFVSGFRSRLADSSAE
eukprot:1414378-Rhodomonas_salina.3